MQSHQTSAPLLRRAAMASGLGTVLILITLSHHPVVQHGSSNRETLLHIAGVEGAAGLVHGLLIAVHVALIWALAVFSRLLGARQPLVIAAGAAYVLAVCLLSGAMLLDGFVVPQMGRQFAGASNTELEMARVSIAAIATVVQVLTKAGLLVMGVAFFAWSWALARSAHLTPWSRAGAVPGMVTALGTAGVIIFADLRLTPLSLMYLLALHALWYCTVGAVLLRAARPAGAFQR